MRHGPCKSPATIVEHEVMDISANGIRTIACLQYTEVGVTD